jgi:competence protein ComFB
MSNNRSIDKEAMYKKIMPSSNQTKIVEESSPLPQPTPFLQPKVLVNVAELAVKERIEEAMDKFKCCQCDHCVKDVLALAVNNLPPKYIVRNELDQALEIRRYDADVISALVNAVIKVKQNPRH